jgi:NADH dehydrogenase FAD-containing subunit
LTGPSNGILVNEHLQSVAHPEIFGGGDCIDLQNRPLAKVGVYAVREGPILYHNLGAALENGALTTFQPQEAYMLIFNLGDGTGLLWKDNILWHGRLAMVLKNYIDTRFMRTYQLSGERVEPE